MRTKPRFNKLLLSAFLAVIAFASQTFIAGAQSWVAEAEQNGFKLKKVVSDTTVPSGQSFSYTIYFTIPPNSSNVTISDNLPSTLKFLAHSFTSACGTPTVSAPAVNSMGGAYSISWASVPGGCTGSITLTVEFPNGVTCDGTAARNNACMSGRVDEKFAEFCTPYVSTTATADNPWHINKYPLGLAWQGGSCPYASGSDTIIYRICVYKDVGTTGQLNLENGVVTDTLPAGAVLVNSNCGATQAGNVVTWNVGSMSSLPNYNTNCCDIEVYYPSGTFPSGSQITNSAVLSGDLGSPNNICDSFTTQSLETCVELVSITSGSLNKWVYTNRQPGCGGRYLIYICNTGTNDIFVTAQDTLPAGLTGFSLGGGSLNATLTGNVVSMIDTLAPGACAYRYIEFTIPSTATVGSNIENCVTMVVNGAAPQEVCRSFTVDAPAANPCLWKQVCDIQPDYEPGDIVRYRLRIQNTGGLPIVGATLTDVLDPNIEYVGNPSFYTDNNWNTPCTTTPANPWSGVSLNYNSSTNTITATIDTIPSTCQDIFYTNCGMYGAYGVPFYFIEFDAKIRDTSALGNVPNSFDLGGGNLTSTHSSNTVNVLVTGVVGYNLEKGVKKPSDPAYADSALTSAGATVEYRLRMNSSGTAALRHVTFVDLLPLDDGTNDSGILQACGARGSMFDITYNGFIASTPSITQYNNPATSLADVNSLAPTGAPGPVFTLGCGSAGSWAPSWTTGQKNLAAYFGDVAIGTGASVEFAADVPLAANPSDSSCNTFAASGWTKHLIQSSLPNYQLAGELESQEACVMIDTSNNSEPCLEELRTKIDCKGLTAEGFQQYAVNVSAYTGCTPAIIYLNSPDGSFSPSNFSVTSGAFSIGSVFTNTSGNNPITIYYSVLCENEVCRDSLIVDLPPCDGHQDDDCCKEFRKEIKDAKLHWNNSGTVYLGASMIAGPAPIKKFDATIVSAQMKRVCFFNSGPWRRIYGDITAGNLSVAPAAGPQLLDIYSREAVWGPGECIDWNKGANLFLKMKFPPFNNSFFCRDSLKFKIRYTFTDCDCKTCDTLITYDIVRRWKPIPWEDDAGDVKLRRLGEASSKNEGIQAETPDRTGLIMDDAEKGTFWIISPDDPENDITVIGVEFRSPEAHPVSIETDNGSGLVQNDLGFVQTDVAPGESLAVSIMFDNSTPLMQFPVTVRFEYKVEGFDETYFSDPMYYIARVPGAATDELAVDVDEQPENVRTYALYFDAINGYDEKVTAIELKPAADSRILAVGPPSEEGENTYMVPRMVDEDVYIVTALDLGEAGIEAGGSMRPIYVTVSGAVDDAEIEYSTYDESANMISSGTLVLTEPISSVVRIDPDRESGIAIRSIAPNPANNTVTINYFADRTFEGVKMSVMDMRGFDVLPIFHDDTVGFGSHVRVIDVDDLPSGMYIVTIRTDRGIATKTLSIVK